MKTDIFFVALGGMAGSVMRYLVSVMTAPVIATAFPGKTFLINAGGSLLMGIFFGLGERTAWMSPHLRLLLMTGFCGGFTTFSTFSLENVLLLKNGEYGILITYTIASLVTCIAAALLGIRLTALGAGH